VTAAAGAIDHSIRSASASQAGDYGVQSPKPVLQTQGSFKQPSAVPAAVGVVTAAGTLLDSGHVHRFALAAGTAARAAPITSAATSALQSLRSPDSRASSTSGVGGSSRGEEGDAEVEVHPFAEGDV
jgi:hypothetical protein